MCSTNFAHHWYQSRCAIRARQFISTDKDLQGERGTTSSFGKVGGGGGGGRETLLKDILNNSMFYLIDELTTVGSLWKAAEIN